MTFIIADTLINKSVTSLLKSVELEPTVGWLIGFPFFSVFFLSPTTLGFVCLNMSLNKSWGPLLCVTPGHSLHELYVSVEVR